MTEPAKVDLKSMSITDDQKVMLNQFFPEVFNEDKIDFDKLRRTLGEDIDEGEERFGMIWPGKNDCFKVIQTPSIATLKPDKEESIDWDNTENLFIEGDNLEILKLLQRSYYGKIKLIYIDPPYNTGAQFIYPDNYTESLDTYLAYTGQTDEEGLRFSTNTEAEGRFHSKWMSMMYPRLFLAKNLLKEDGVIFISIDDNEVKNLRTIMDEIFGEENFIGQFIWKSRQNKDNRNVTGASIDHEYILCYGRRIRGGERNLEQYSNPDNDPRGDWASANMVGILPEDQRPNCHYDLINPQTNINYGKPQMGWRYDKNTMYKLIEEDKIIWPSDSSGRPRRKLFLSELKEKFTGYSSIVGQAIYTRTGTLEIEDLFSFRAFDFPKPSILLKELITQGLNDSNNEIVLDFFAGSCPLSHAVLDIDKENEKANHRFIVVQLPEHCAEQSEAFKQGYKTIADIGKERIRRVIKKIEEEQSAEAKDAEKTLPGMAEAKVKLDLGFKVFKLDKSNFNIWDGTVDKDGDVSDQIELFVDHIDPDSRDEDILYEILLKSGFELTTKIEELDIAGKKVYSIADNALLICLDRKLTKEVITEMARLQPARVVCLDAGFADNDQLKTNAVQIMKSHDVEDFRTV